MFAGLRRTRRTLSVAAAAAGLAAATVAVTPPTAFAAAQPVVTVDSATDHEGTLVCSEGFGGPPPPCGTTVTNALRFYVRTSTRAAITVNWQLVPGTATAGADYTGPTTGSVTIPYSNWGTSFQVPLVYDGFTEAATEQFTVRLTGSSIPANLTDTGTGTIRDGRQVPADCAMSLPAGTTYAMTMTCTNRPAGQQWQLQAYCWPFGQMIDHYGPVVTGNGQSTIDCGGAPINGPFFRTV
ncbi:MAG TPA: hypothetical protein VGD67_19990 [Pseudonocardiaceae bacterium]